MIVSALPERLREAVVAADAALDALINALAAPGPDGLTGLATGEVMSVAAEVERLRNRWSLTDRPMITELDRRCAAEEQLRRSTAHLLADALRLAQPEANQRVTTVRALTPRPMPTGGSEPPRYPVLALAQAQGSVSPDQVRTILTGLDRIDRLIGLRPSETDEPVGPGDLARAEHDLCREAQLFAPSDLRRCADRILDCLEPDGDPDRSEASRRQRRVSLRERSDGMWRINGDLLPETGEALRSILRPLARPRSDDPGSSPLDTADPRSPEQRDHDALAEVVARVGRSGGLPVAGGVPVTVIVTIDEDSLRARVGQAWTAAGSMLPVPTLLRMADEAEIIPTVLNTAGAVLWQGRSKRIATTVQTLALYGRDGGCTFPGCGHPPDWRERHHIVAWDDGGETTIGNLTLLCRYHHRRFEKHGWQCRMIDGLPYWTAPPQLDPAQVPRLHHRLAHARRERAAKRARLSARSTVGTPPVPTAFVITPARWSDFAVH